ncbi:hypothetical protein, partial [Paeniglutamicibacter gangotriensis]|uniref:hypothetical protein n=1 Tax=Paeniglutamicibacter gangotriensis TaxID=254787 RepID=UPI001CB72278
ASARCSDFGGKCALDKLHFPLNDGHFVFKPPVTAQNYRWIEAKVMDCHCSRDILRRDDRRFAVIKAKR